MCLKPRWSSLEADLATISLDLPTKIRPSKSSSRSCRTALMRVSSTREFIANVCLVEIVN